MIDSAQPPAARCTRCGADMRPPAPAGLCSACRLIVPSEPASDLSSNAVTALPAMTASSSRPGAPARLAPDQEFGSYHIVRLLGRGGMGEVYEAEQRDQGRRVALKLLNQRLTDPHDRARFLREGQLAASINHHNSVYIFGSEEIDGIPVIAMELLVGGTLGDRVRRQGPLPPAAAVDAILQVVAGLDAAYAGGILHRDVKPSNCFVDRDGTVKIGDFGLSISTEAGDATTLTSIGVFHGTPQFAPPERLKGVAQDVGADIYAVGATLYFLLTGQPPFEDINLMALLTRIATEPPRSPRELQPRVPRGLAKVVLRCLAKDRGARPTTYAALDEALRPFGSAAPTPATLGLRVAAGAIDSAIIAIPLAPVNMTLAFRRAAGLPWWLTIAELIVMIAYYGILEGLWGASLGKRAAGLRVTTADGQPPGMAQAFWRAMVFQTPSLLGSLLVLLVGQRRLMELVAASPRLGYTMGLGTYVLIGLLFSTARRRNGFAGVHELASGTRVVRRLARGARSVLGETRDPAAVAGASRQLYGPYEVVGSLGRTDVGELLLAFDPGLRRQVWIHALPPGTPAVAPLVRDLSRSGRLRWLNGARSDSDAWDAYEALNGEPLASVLGVPQPWHLVRGWLADLAREIDAGLQDGSLSALKVEHVWITRDGYAKLLDFRAPDVQPTARQDEPPTLESGQTFLAFVARRALDGSDDEPGASVARAREALPLSASATLETLARHGFGTSSEVVARTSALRQGPDRVGHWRRAASLAIFGVVPASVVALMLLINPLMSRALPPDLMALDSALRRLEALGRVPGRERAALEVYIAGRFRPMITDRQTWTNPATVGILGPRRLLAERVVAEHPTVSTDELAAATAWLGPFLRAQKRAQERASSFFSLSRDSAGAVMGVSLVLLTFIAPFGLVWAVLLRGGLLLRTCGIAVVTVDGKPASRLRALWRALIAWGLVPTALVLVVRMGPGIGSLAGVLLLMGAVLAIVEPGRGLQDRLAGTRLVPQ